MLSLDKLFRRSRRKKCQNEHKQYWELVSHGHRKCSKCGAHWTRGGSDPSGVTDKDRKIMPKEVVGG